MTFHIEAYYSSSHRNGPEILCTPEDVDALIAKLVKLPESHGVAALCIAERVDPETGFPDHQFYLAVDGEARLGAVKYADTNGNWASDGYPENQSGTSTYLYFGEGMEFPPNSGIPLDLACQAVKEFLSGGGERPSCTPWQVDTCV
ncbi:Imm1 family immunity protein [Rhizohabitans arisaemae]|uniref:Imm1 family immunity protein n=1 Tax=Rhizohabitans arisaemae TaxID=2720610 RepID=UPI0024B152E4|nr:Imm1 family immunity protein [Rhizohabitans arisaemae]